MEEKGFKEGEKTSIGSTHTYVSNTSPCIVCRKVCECVLFSPTSNSCPSSALK